MMEQPALNTCQQCGKPLRGRAEKKFCDSGCKNLYNNELRAIENAAVRQVRGLLLKNRRILQGLLAEKEVRKIKGIALREQGFVFTYHTHHYLTKDKRQYTFCFDYGYLEVEEDYFVLIRRVG